MGKKSERGVGVGGGWEGRGGHRPKIEEQQFKSKPIPFHTMAKSLDGPVTQSRNRSFSEQRGS